MKRRIAIFVICMVVIASMFAMPVNALAQTARTMKIRQAVYLRSTEDIYDVIGSLKKNAKVWFTGKTWKEFYKVQTEDGKTGYIFKLYLKEQDSNDNYPICQLTAKSKLYKKPSQYASRVTTLKEGRWLLVLGVKDGWAKVITANDKEGYVPCNLLVKR